MDGQICAAVPDGFGSSVGPKILAQAIVWLAKSALNIGPSFGIGLLSYFFDARLFLLDSFVNAFLHSRIVPCGRRRNNCHNERDSSPELSELSFKEGEE
jgi:hypothetical protein